MNVKCEPSQTLFIIYNDSMRERLKNGRFFHASFLRGGGNGLRLTGRIKILTDVKEVNEDNILQVLQKAYAKHRLNACEIQYLIDYEAGIQPLPFEKTIRPEINIETIDNMANYVTEFKKGYFWGIPPIYTQRGNKEHHDTDEDIDSSGIAALNEMMLNGVCIGAENQKLSDFVEKVGIGHRLIDPKTDWENDEKQSTYANVYTLDSRNAFCVYHNGVGQKKVLGVTYVKNGTRNLFTCFTDKYRFEIESGKITEIRANLMGMIPIVEYERSVDRTGCFERQISLMDNLNSMVSNFANDVAQKTQELWWGNDIDFPRDETTGEYIKPKSGQWLLTNSAGEGKNQKIQPLSSTFDSTPTLNAISDVRNQILKQCFVPMQYSSEGGGSTGTATDTMSGWNATAVDSARQEQLVSGLAREELILLLRAVNLAPTKVLSADDPLRKIHASDIDIHFTRQKNYDINSKINAVATAVNIGVNGRHALKIGGGAWPDIEQVWLDSKDTMEAYQKSLFNKDFSSEESERLTQDSGDQSRQSPAIDGLQTDNAKQMT